MKLIPLNLYYHALVTGHGNAVALSPKSVFYRTKIFKEKIFASFYVPIIANMQTILQNVHQEEWL